MALVNVIEEYGEPGSITHFPNMIKKELESKDPGIDMSKATPDQMKEAKKTVCEKIPCCTLPCWGKRTEVW
jgi:hypothetical protein